MTAVEWFAKEIIKKCNISLFEYPDIYEKAREMEIKQQERMYSEESECVNMYLDDLKIPRKSEDGQEYSIVGRIKQLEKKILKTTI